MGQWAIVISAERYEAERLFHHDALVLTGLDTGPADGDEVLVVVAGQPASAVAIGVASRRAGADVALTYTRRSFDDPRPVDDLPLPGSPAPPPGTLAPLDRATFETAAARLGPPRDSQPWHVTLHLPIEAPTAGEAARQFWSYAMGLGPRELPVFVTPKGDESAVTAYVLGVETSLDPEDDDEPTG